MAKGKAFIGVGANIDPENNILKALMLLRERVKVVAVSTFYLTEPVGAHRQSQPAFYNGVVQVETYLPPMELKTGILREVEVALGRRRGGDKFAPRPIDLDVVVYDEVVMKADGLELPDPDIRSRAFLALPLYELSPCINLPGFNETLGDILVRFENHGMTPLTEFTGKLRKALNLGKP